MDPRRLLFGLYYRLGFTPWVGHPVPLALKMLVEGPRALPPGRALDIGCGTGDLSIYLASMGWDCTGVDFVEAALRRARRRVAPSGPAPRFLWADARALRASLEPEATFRLLVDAGCYHGLRPGERDAWAREVTALAEPDAMLVLCAFDEGHAPNPRLGATRADVEGRLRSGWTLVHEAIDPTLSSELHHMRVYHLRRARP